MTLYWVTRTATSSVRLDYENRLRPVHLRRGERVRVPTAIARFPLEVPMPPLPWIKRGYDVERYTEMPSGGHFAAWEEPDLLAADLRAFFADRPERTATVDCWRQVGITHRCHHGPVAAPLLASAVSIDEVKRGGSESSCATLSETLHSPPRHNEDSNAGALLDLAGKRCQPSQEIEPDLCKLILPAEWQTLQRAPRRYFSM